MFFFLAVQLAGCIQSIVQVTSREFAIMVVFIVFGYIEIYRTLTFVCIAGIQNLFYQFDLFDDMSRGMWLNAGGKYVQCLHGFMIPVQVVLHYFHGFQLFQTGFLGNLIFAFICVMFQVAYVGNVTHVSHFITQPGEITEEYVERDGRTGMSQMCIAIYRRSADIHAHMWSVQRHKQLFFSI